jgi:general secretion pathway protein A
MYNEYFGFKEAPFSIAPDPRYLYMTPQHREALAHLVYGLNSEGGCILLTGEVGTGKTTVCRCLLEQIPEQARVALVLNPRVSAIELLETICDELKIDYPEEGNTVKTYIDRINRFLIEANARNEKTVLIIDEAQNLDSSVLEQLRLLTNLETNQRKLLQIIILGQPELLDILARPEMRQLAQRITARFHLNALSYDEVRAYIAHRLAVAGQNVQLFPETVLRRLFRLSKGIPRLINILCDRALLGCYVQNIYNVDTRTLNTAAKEVFGELKNVENRQQRKYWPLYIALFVALSASAALAYWHFNSIETVAASAASTASSTSNTVVSTNSTEAPASTTANTTAAISASTTETAVEQNPSSTSATAPVEDDLQSFIAQASSNSKADAYQTLFALWQQKYSEDSHQNACSFATQHGLSCLHRQGNLNSIKFINYPALLHVYNADGSNAFVTLKQLDQGRAILQSGKTEFSVAIPTLEKHWYGEYSLLWKTPPFYTSALQIGDSGPVVQWLDQQLARLIPDSKATIRNDYNQEMATRVSEFQRSVGLPDDGIAGPLTFIHLNIAMNMTAPHLFTPKKKAQ